MIHLILGGARSGKSSFALSQVTQLSQANQKNVVFIATATASDGEMSERIIRHQAERPKHWTLIEEPLHLDQTINRCESSIVLIDCLTLWLNNQLFADPEQDFSVLFSQLQSALARSNCDLFLVSNEVGLGVIPMGEISRQFVDQAGWLNQALAKQADKVTFVAAGLPMQLKGNNHD